MADCAGSNRLSGVKTTSASATYDSNGKLSFTGYELRVTKFIRIGNDILPSKEGMSTNRFYHNDHLGGVNIISDFNGARIQLTEYDPWGKISRSDQVADPTHRFTGQEVDSESGIHHYGGRYYDQGRVASSAPISSYCRLAHHKALIGMHMFLTVHKIILIPPDIFGNTLTAPSNSQRHTPSLKSLQYILFYRGLESQVLSREKPPRTAAATPGMPRWEAKLLLDSMID